MPANALTYKRSFSRASRLAAALLPVLLVGAQWLTDVVLPGNLLFEVPVVQQYEWLERRWAYFYLHILTFLPVLLLSFDRNVHYYKKWGALFPAIIVVAAIFIGWDVFFTAQGVWGFNERYLAGWHLLGLPVEEWLFFFTVPFACAFIYECLNFYVKPDLLGRAEKVLTPMMGFGFFLVGLLHWGQLYTSTTFLLTGGFTLYHWRFLDVPYRSRFYLSYLVALIPFLIVNGVLTGGYTEQPVVVYNPEEYLGIRITSVPLDDAVYGFLMMFGVITLFEKWRA
ncbi:lycopene cyclase domain-containing protein [Phaeodactylibacter luteus]|uniref:Lycopene cyclase domain-containing protein n=1 Tax=Phaeodactylibacter luteus TaxID=1564516 RepID=A0A5C6RNA0_9BACT|nr:lycopene cyclase domain-containing protein [Phaeodactylibacter luteus]TXB62862.1 lycopene cyclase domain-containing protein [Phaeodactylibacter luteus]